jgi:hypothetical protein
MRHHHHVVADPAGAARFEWFAEVQRELVAEEIEINPRVGASTFNATEDAAIKPARFIEVGYVNGEVKKRLHGVPAKQIAEC